MTDLKTNTVGEGDMGMEGGARLSIRPSGEGRGWRPRWVRDIRLGGKDSFGGNEKFNISIPFFLIDPAPIFKIFKTR